MAVVVPAWAFNFQESFLLAPRSWWQSADSQDVSAMALTQLQPRLQESQLQVTVPVFNTDKVPAAVLLLLACPSLQVLTPVVVRDLEPAPEQAASVSLTLQPSRALANFARVSHTCRLEVRLGRVSMPLWSPLGKQVTLDIPFVTIFGTLYFLAEAPPQFNNSNASQVDDRPENRPTGSPKPTAAPTQSPTPTEVASGSGPSKVVLQTVAGLLASFIVVTTLVGLAMIYRRYVPMLARRFFFEDP